METTHRVDTPAIESSQNRARIHLVRWPTAIALIVVAGACYGLAFGTRAGGGAVLVGLPCIALLSRFSNTRNAFYAGLLCGLAIYGPHLAFLFTIFGLAAFALVVIAGLPIGVFAALLHKIRQQFGPAMAMWMTPIVWTGIEFFKSELWYLKFAWILPGQALAFLPGARTLILGVYGVGFVFMLAAAMAVGHRTIWRAIGIAGLIGLGAFAYVPASSAEGATSSSLHVAGIQLEHASEDEVAAGCDHLAVAHPEAQLLVLSEYSFSGRVPQAVRDMVHRHKRYLIAGGVVFESKDRYRDTAFVIDPDGREIFQQGKSVPVQFMSDGIPAEQRQVWDSPWGKIGIGICYDVSYARVCDDFVRQGAAGLVFPTMDLASWGEYERSMLHGRLAPVRSTEYGIPVFGVWSSGISQLTDRRGHVIANAGYPGQGETIAGPFDLRVAGRVPLDRYPAFTASLLVGAMIVYFIFAAAYTRVRRGRAEAISNASSPPAVG